MLTPGLAFSTLSILLIQSPYRNPSAALHDDADGVGVHAGKDGGGSDGAFLIAQV